MPIPVPLDVPAGRIGPIFLGMEGDAAWFAWQIDDILVADGATTIFSNDGTPTDMMASNNVSIGGNLWHVTTGTGLPSPDHFADCNDSTTNTYNPNMVNSFVSDYFWLPDTLTEIYLDFFCQG